MIGQTLSHYRVTAKLGSGGMGEVYRATDERLGRAVAIKVLPETVASDTARLARFKREAKLLAALNHTNIASIHGLETVDDRPFLVLELVEGEDLKALIERGPLPLARAVRIALQIGRALEAAHAQDIVHRDVKPSNVRIGAGDEVKVLDLGLAKALRDEGQGDSESRAQTETMHETREGVIIGTAPYMSPEHVRGDLADRQADIWAWACVFFELLTGRRAFGGSTRPDVFAAVLDREPDWDALPDGTPHVVRRLLERCLRKEKRRRLRDIGDACLELEDLLSAPPSKEQRPVGRSSVHGGRLAAAAVAGAVLATLAGWGLSPRSAGDSVARFVIQPPGGVEIPEVESLAISRDGSRIAFLGTSEGRSRRIYVRRIDRLEARPVEGTDAGLAPSFSPNGDLLIFHAGGALRTVSVEGGPVTTLAQSGSPAGRGSLWDENGVVFPSGNIAARLNWLRSGASEAEPLGEPAVEKGEIAHSYPMSLPGTGNLLFSIWGDEGWKLAVMSLEHRTWKEVLLDARKGVYLEPGVVVYLAKTTLMAVPFDLRTATVTGAAQPLLDAVSAFALSEAGTLVYRPVTPGPTELVWLDRSGAFEKVIEESGVYYTPRLSTDGRLLAFSSQSPAFDGVATLILDLDRGARWIVSRTGSINNFPVWNPDGSELVFNALRRSPGIYRVASEGAREPELLLARTEEPKVPTAWSSDGRFILFVQLTPRGRDVWALPLEAGSEPFPLLATPADEGSPALSPDGRWMAYVSNESGRREVYARAFPGGGGRLTLSTNGGGDPRFSSDGSELFYVQGRSLMTVALGSGSALRPGKPRVLIERFDPAPSRFPMYDVSPDGRRFVVARTASGSQDPGELRVVVGWREELLATLGL